MTFRCANQRRDLVGREDLIPAHHAKLLHEQSEQRLSLLHRAGTQNRAKILGPLRDVDGVRGLCGAFRCPLRERGLLRDQRVDAGLQLGGPFLAVGGGERPLLERGEVAIQ